MLSQQLHGAAQHEVCCARHEDPLCLWLEWLAVLLPACTAFAVCVPELWVWVPLALCLLSHFIINCATGSYT